MIIEISDDSSIVKWKKNDKEDWKSAEISDLIKAYEEKPQIQLPNGVTYAPKLFNGCAVCDKHEVCPDAFCSNAIHCNAYGIPNFHKENESTYTCCGSCYLCDVDDCGEDMRKGGNK